MDCVLPQPSPLCLSPCSHDLTPFDKSPIDVVSTGDIRSMRGANRLLSESIKGFNRFGMDLQGIGVRGSGPSQMLSPTLTSTPKQARHYDTIANQRARDMVVSKSQVATTLSGNDSVLREKDKLPRHLMGMVYANSRCLTWGTPFPMTSLERHVHRLFSRGLGIESDPTELPWRPIYELASCKLGPQMFITACVVHPAIATCTVPLGATDGEEACLRCLDGIDILSEPSSGNFNHKVTVERGKRKLSGRMAMRAFRPDHREHDDEEGTLPTYVNMSSSCLLFQVSLMGKSWTCSPSVECLRLIRSKCSDSYSVSMANNRLMIHLWLSSTSNDTHVKVSANGSLTVVGSPGLVEGVAGTLSQMLGQLLSNKDWCIELLDTLRVTSTCGSIVRAS